MKLDRALALLLLFTSLGCTPRSDQSPPAAPEPTTEESADQGGTTPQFGLPDLSPQAPPEDAPVPSPKPGGSPPPPPVVPEMDAEGGSAAEESGDLSPPPEPMTTGERASISPTKEREVDVFFATDRLPTQSEDPNAAYGKKRNRAGPLEYGTLRVSIPPNHRMGLVERPRWYRLEFSEDPKKHVMIRDLSVLPKNQYFELLSATSKDEALLFIHGFNVSFAEGARRTAQIVFDLDFPGTPLYYSWPSQGAIESYTVDEDNAEWAIPHLASFLLDVQEKTEFQRIHVIAHSMGARLLSYALAHAKGEGFDLDLNHVILAAPDIDADVFQEQILPKIGDMAERLTMYASSGDTALQVSQRLNGNDRLGLSGSDSLRVFPGMDTVDASEVNTSLIGHAYYGEHTEVMGDILALVIRGLDPIG
ncbi:MAG: alpha/beta fold hydrolase, partial [Verrucomicrobiota bacterium]